MTTRDWRHRAACREERSDLFFPAGESGVNAIQIDEAKSVCRRCPAIHHCLAWAIETGQEAGIWGGTTETERKNYRRRQRKNGATA